MKLHTLLLVVPLVLLISACGDERPRDAAENPLTFTGTQFLAVSVSDLETSRSWYRDVFELELAMDQASPDGTARTAVLESPRLVVELSEHARARSIQDYAGEPTPTFLVHGFFKGTLVVANADSAVAELVRRGVRGLSPVRADSTSASPSRFAFLKDPDGNFLQLLERDWQP